MANNGSMVILPCAVLAMCCSCHVLFLPCAVLAMCCSRSLLSGRTTSFSLFKSRPAWRRARVRTNTSAIHHLAVYLIQMLANPAILIYQARGEGEGHNRQKDLVRWVPHLLVCFARIRPRPPLAVLFAQTSRATAGALTIRGCRTLKNLRDSVAMGCPHGRGLPK
jgi:hypothetical protein